MDDVKIKIDTEAISNRVAELMNRGFQISNKLELMTEEEPASEQELMQSIRSGVDMAHQLQEICEDLMNLQRLSTLAEMFGGDDN